MKKTISIITSGTLLLSLCSFTGCGLMKKPEEKKLDLSESMANIEDDFVEWYLSEHSSGDEETAKSILEDVEVAADGSYLSLSYISKYDYNNSEEVNNVSEFLFSIEINQGLEIAELLNKELGFPDSVMKKMETTSGKDGKQTYENDEVILTWSYQARDHFDWLYERK